jgi:hypothetical protein
MTGTPFCGSKLHAHRGGVSCLPSADVNAFTQEESPL